MTDVLSPRPGRGPWGLESARCSGPFAGSSAAVCVSASSRAAVAGHLGLCPPTQPCVGRARRCVCLLVRQERCCRAATCGVCEGMHRARMGSGATGARAARSEGATLVSERAGPWRPSCERALRNCRDVISSQRTLGRARTHAMLKHARKKAAKHSHAIDPTHTAHEHDPSSVSC